MRGAVGVAAVMFGVIACWLVGTATAQQGGIEPTDADLRQAISQQRQQTDRVLDRKCLPNPYRPYQYKRVSTIPAGRLKPIERTWGRRLHVAYRVHSGCVLTAYRERMLWSWFRTSGAACVKSREGAWTSNTGNGYYGGFQANLAFQRAYGWRHYSRLGTADRWPPVLQIDMAFRGWQARGWSPWPNTARMCGLL